MLNEKQVLQIAAMARLNLTDEEVVLFSSQLTNILEYVEMLAEVDTENVEPTYQSTGLVNVLGDDEVMKFDEDLLSCSELPIKFKQIQVKKVF